MTSSLLRGAFAIFKRDFQKFLSNPFVILMTLFMPIMYLIIFGSAMGGSISHIPIGVVQDEPYLVETPLFASAVAGLSTMQQVDNPPTFDVTVFTDEASARRAVTDGRIMAAVIFPSSISADNTIRMYMDSSEFTIPALIQAGLNGVLAQNGAHNPVQVTKIYGDIGYLQFFGVGVIVMAIFMTTMMGGGMAMIRDREMGIVEGYLVTPVKRSSTLLGIIASGTVKGFLAGFIILLVDLFVAGIVIDSAVNFLLILAVIFIISIGLTSLVVAFASRFANQQIFASSVAFLNLILFMTSGAFYPTLGMPDWLRWITVINPESYGVHALRSLVLRGQGLNLIGIDLLALIIFSVFAIAIGIATFRRTLD
ncbi:ABC transporter permease [Methanosphaerula palustris]|uniref:ABC-2 type transporter n=1 Tax=Methanosphaerula palustris (strain ATCC BAA-1556 / DSM 19958 / E1-9c) TaxID=521011 RepID=B8GHI8_METPE|nr:ABC transporter permease [Methanosphaerula palustris]ACL16593.1 ABC-2 type transporter [Methanosphaerula palustris E1-9c]